MIFIQNVKNFLISLYINKNFERADLILYGDNTREMVAIQDHDGRTMGMKYNYLDICN